MQSLRMNQRAFMGDAVKYLPSMVAPALVNLLLLPVATRLFPPAAYGNYVLASTTLSFLQLITNAWLSSSIVRFYAIAEIEGDTRRLNSTAFTVTLVQSLASALLCLGVTLALRTRIDAELFTLLLLVAVQLVAAGLMLLPLQVLRVQRRLGRYNVFSVGRSFLPLAAGVAFSLLWHRNVVGMLAGSALASWLLMPLSYLLCFGTQNQPAPRLAVMSWVRKLVTYGGPLVPALLMVETLDISDRFIVGAYRGSVEAGIYNANYSVAALTMQLITLFVTSAGAPLVVSVWERQGRRATELMLTFLTRVMILIGIPAVVGLSVLAREIVALVSAPAYIEGAIIIPFVAAGVFLAGLQWIAQRGMMLANRTVLIMVLYLVAGLSNIAANVVLVPRYGYVAAGWTTFGAYVILLVVIAVGSAPYLTWRIPGASLLRSVAASAAMALVLVGLRNLAVRPMLIQMVVKVSAGAGVYLVVLLMLREISLRKALAFVTAGIGRSLDNHVAEQ